ncbi:ABC transporter permease [Candidatus Halocynthiibacter alkanivorans]|uniref:ABC transporter permease n=1 Tax=Candidatus Halocynthiibacter alkanivorans TaxID=2267619 RepID=UPI000DF1AD8E|nr:ABC transporter permease [Candidatus Halocynthiibacter alkanivorans]
MIEFSVRTSVGWQAQFAAYVLALTLGFATSALLIAASGASVSEGFGALYEGAFGSREAILQSLVAATPLIFTGLATVIAFRAEIWSIGQEGQMFAGAMSGYWISLYLGGVSALVAIPMILIAAMAGGAALGGFCGWLKTRFQVNEIISTVMLNYVIVYLLSYLLAGGPWTEEGTTSYQQTPVFADNFHLPLIVSDVKLHIGFLLALAAAVICWVILKKTPLGFEIRALGFNPTALRFKGVNVTRTVLIVMCLSGALSALAGVSEIFGVNYRLRGDVLVGLGFTGIIVGMIGGLNPIGAVVAALFFGALANGSLYMSVLSDIPPSLVPAMQGILLLFFLSASVLVRFSVQFRRPTNV